VTSSVTDFSNVINRTVIPHLPWHNFCFLPVHNAYAYSAGHNKRKKQLQYNSWFCSVVHMQFLLEVWINSGTWYVCGWIILLHVCLQNLLLFKDIHLQQGHWTGFLCMMWSFSVYCKTPTHGVLWKPVVVVFSVKGSNGTFSFHTPLKAEQLEWKDIKFETVLQCLFIIQYKSRLPSSFSFVF
jgi:hypothetical protein